MHEQSQAGMIIAQSVEQVAHVVEETLRSVSLAEKIAQEIDTASAELLESVLRFRL
jgi:methyl-accepting chemotaxis protein